jgi:hypothetical protein
MKWLQIHNVPTAPAIDNIFPNLFPLRFFSDTLGIFRR